MWTLTYCVSDLRCGSVTLNLNIRIALSRHCVADDDFDIPGETNIHKVMRGRSNDKV